MRSYILPLGIIVLCGVMFLQCGGPHARPSARGSAARDSIASADSSGAQNRQVAAVKLTYEESQGKMLYTKYCAVCHGDQGKGDGFNAYNLDPKPRDFTDPRAMAGIDDATMLATITEGGSGVNKSPLMPAWGGRMNTLQMEYVVAYVHALERQQ